jgi:excisionase family DNA binding protein
MARIILAARLNWPGWLSSCPGKELRMAGKQPDDVMTIDELAAYLKLSKSSLYHFARAGKVPGVKIGEQWRFQKSVIDAWMKDRIRTKAYDKPRAKRSK